MSHLYELEHRQVGYSTFLAIVSKRQGLEIKSSEKVIPPILEYDEQGDYRIIGPREVVSGLITHPYKAITRDFNEERLADLQVTDLSNHLKHFPTLNAVYTDNIREVHPIAEYLYSQIIYLKPTEAFQKTLNKASYIKRSKLIPQALELLAQKLHTDRKLKLDLHSVPKREVASFCYIADPDDYAPAVKLFSFGFHRAIPCDRIARELSSLKAAEKFLNPTPLPFELPDAIKPYVTMLRVAIVGTQHSTLDSGDLYPSAIPKLASNISRLRIVKDISSIPKDKRNIELRPFKAGIQVLHVEKHEIDELTTEPGAIRLVLPGGVKLAAQLQQTQARDKQNKHIDLLISFETVAKKGAICLFAMDDPENFSKNLSLEDCITYFNSLSPQVIRVNNTEFEGYIVDIPVLRPGQRYTELSKPSDSVSVDLISKAILAKEYKVSPDIEREYKDIIDLRSAIKRELELT